ncbi:MAG: sulfotransferase family 2 domain-containing protein [Pseudomonadota bacterium]
MIVSYGRRYIFIHIPKTGGTSLALALESRAMADDVMVGDTPKARRRRRRVRDVPTSGRLWKHSRLGDIYGLVDQDQIDNFFVFTLIRNPWDRVVSYYHWLRCQDFAHPMVGLAQRLDFPDFLADPGVARSFKNDAAGSYVTDRLGQEKCDLFLRLEHLDQDVARLEDALGVSVAPLPHANRSSRAGDYRSYYSDADAARVEALFAADVARFGYRF